MKVDAIASRSSRRDFVDLCMTARLYGLNQILAWFTTKYAAAPYNRLHLLKSLTYFADAEREPMPNLIAPLEWSTVTTFFLSQIARVSDLR